MAIPWFYRSGYVVWRRFPNNSKVVRTKVPVLKGDRVMADSKIYLLIVVILGIIVVGSLLGVICLPVFGVKLTTEAITFLSTVMSTALGALIGVLKVGGANAVESR